MGRVRKFFEFHARVLRVLYRDAFAFTDKRAFAKLFNLKSLLIGGTARLSWRDGMFFASDSKMPGVRIRFRHVGLGLMYQFGIARRARSLGEDYFLNMIDFRDGDIVFDCGANIGDLKLWFRLHGIDVQYVGFEPAPMEFRCLVENVAPSKVFNVGLWNEEGVLRFYIASQSADSSLIEPAHYDEVIEVQTKRLDGFLTEKVKCLKLEAEGAEPEILEGIGDKLHLVEYVTADCGWERGVKQESTLAPVTNFLVSRGFEMIAVNHVRICALYRNTRFVP